jgi:pyrroline-5-carboxylate reductase
LGSAYIDEVNHFCFFLQVIALENESELAAMMSTSALMASYYEWQGAAHKWLVAQGLPSKPATEYVSSLFLALSTKAAHVEDGFDDIVSKSQTPGGINEQVLRNLKSEGWFEGVGKQLDAILARVTGKPKA